MLLCGRASFVSAKRCVYNVIYNCNDALKRRFATRVTKFVRKEKRTPATVSFLPESLDCGVSLNISELLRQKVFFLCGTMSYKQPLPVLV